MASKKPLTEKDVQKQYDPDEARRRLEHGVRQTEPLRKVVEVLRDE